VSKEIELTLIGKPGCHLCDEAEAVVNEVLAEVAVQVSLTKLNILEDEELFARFSEEIPVLLIEGQVHNYWRIDPQRLKEALRS
jgi:thiol-disulfide isomerase/thioredoxin